MPSRFFVRAVFYTTVVFCAMTAYGQTKAQVKLLRAKVARQSDDNREKADAYLEFGTYILFKPGELKEDLDSAAFYCVEATKISRRLNYENGIAQGYLLEGRIFQERGNHEAKYASFRKALSYARSRKLYVAEAEAIIGLAQKWQATPEQLTYKMDEYKKALSVFAKVGNKAGKPYARALKDMADFHQLYGEFDEALVYLKKSLSVSKSINDHDVQGVYILLASIYRFKGEFETALKYALEAEKFAEANEDEGAQTEMIYNHIALLYFDLQRNEKALEYFTKSLELAKKNNDVNSISTVLANIANVHIRNKNYSYAIKIFDRIARDYPSKRADDQIRLECNYVMTYGTINQIEKARPHFEKLLSLEQAGIREGAQMDKFDGTIVYYYQKSKQAEKTYPYLEKIKAKLKGSKNLLKLADLELKYFRSDSATGKYVDAIRHLKNYKGLSDSIFNLEKNKQFSAMELDYESDKKDKNIQLLRKQAELQQAKIQNDEIVKYIFGGFLIVLVLLVAVILNRYRLKQRSTKKLESKQQEINFQNELLKELVSEKEWLLKEIHHRVKNNLQIVISLLNTQSAYLDNEDAIEAIRNSQHRMHAMSLIHQKLYLSENLSKIDMVWYIHELVGYLKDSFESEKRISYKIEADALELDVAQAVPVGLILNEAINNSIKYAFPGSLKGTIRVALKNLGDHYFSLSIADDGVGLPDGFSIEQSDSLGMNLMQGLARQLGGEFSLQNQNGLTVQVNFKKNLQLFQQQNQDERKDFTS